MLSKSISSDIHLSNLTSSCLSLDSLGTSQKGTWKLFSHVLRSLFFRILQIASVPSLSQSETEGDWTDYIEPFLTLRTVSFGFSYSCLYSLPPFYHSLLLTHAVFCLSPTSSSVPTNLPVKHNLFFLSLFSTLPLFLSLSLIFPLLSSNLPLTHTLKHTALVSVQDQTALPLPSRERVKQKYIHKQPCLADNVLFKVML